MDDAPTNEEGFEMSEDELAQQRARREAEGESDPTAIEDMPEEEPTEDEIPLPRLAADNQLSLNVGGKKRHPIEAAISIMSASRDIAATLDPDVEQVLVISVIPQRYINVPIKENGVTVRWKQVQQCRMTRVARMGTEQAADILAAAG